MNEKLVIFDNDGTLYKTESVSIEAIQNAFMDLNLQKPSGKKILSLVGESMETFCEKILPDKSPEIYKKLSERIRYHERILIPIKAELFNNIKEIIEELHLDGYTLAICTNASKPYIDLIFKTLGIANLFKYIKVKDLKKTKADLIKEILDISNPSFAIVVGDTIHDINAAHLNSLLCIAVKYGYGRNEDITKADYIAHNPEDIISIIKNINSI